MTNKTEKTPLSQEEIQSLIQVVLQEDLGSAGDITARALISEDEIAIMTLVLKERATIAGLPLLEPLFQIIDPRTKVTLNAVEGGKYLPGTALAKLEGPARALFSGERAALNLIQHASSVATQTARFVKMLNGLNCFLLDTRKTLPGLRSFEQYAFELAGGYRHRRSLHDSFVIKRNHLNFFSKTSKTPYKEAVQKAREFLPEVPIEIEVSSLTQAELAAETECDSIMLYHLSPRECRTAVKRIRPTGKKIYYEGGNEVVMETIRAFAESGVDGIATSSPYFASPLDIRLRLKP